MVVLLVQRLAQAEVSLVCAASKHCLPEKPGQEERRDERLGGNWAFLMSAVVCGSAFSPGCRQGRFQKGQSLHPGFTLLTPLHMILNAS